MKTIFLGSNTINFGRNKGSKDKKKRIINNSPSANGQIPLDKVGQERTGYKYYRKRRALGFLGTATVLGGGLGYSLGGAMGLNKKAALAGTIIGAGVGGGSSLLEHARNKYSPFYQKNLFKKKKNSHD